MDRDTLLSITDYSRSRLLGTLETIEKSGGGHEESPRVATGAGASAYFLAVHALAATHDRYLNVGIKGGKPNDEWLCTNFAGGSTPSDDLVPDIATIRATLEKTYKPFREFLAALHPKTLDRKYPNNRTLAESYQLLAWHEGHHQGQIHLTWNMYKHAHGLK